jgi:molybdate transport repressor ModE-like protein
MDDWNEPQLVLAVHRAGSLTGAAKALGIDHSTAFRRLNAVETRLGVRLFERLPGGSYEATAAGERMAAAAERMEDEALALDRAIAGRDRRLSGPLRVTSSETLAYRELTRHLAVFRKQHPGIVVELAIDNRVLSLSRREADIALRPIRPKEGDLWGRKLADVAWAVYGARDCVEATDGVLASADELGRYGVIGWEETAIGIRAADWLNRQVATESFVYRTNSLVNQMVAARAGIGLALLPCYLGDRDTGLARALADPVPDLAGELWIVTHHDLKETARVRAFFDIVGEAIASERGLFDGQGLILSELGK